MDRRVRRIVELLQEKWPDAVRVRDLAQRVGLGASRLEHLFKNDAKVTIREFVHERRLLAAADLLLTTDERVSAICHRVGFNDVSNFNHAFKRRFGLPPREFRARDSELIGVEAEKADHTK
jgi:AraC-type DNA-binding domain-containing proteins